MLILAGTLPLFSPLATLVAALVAAVAAWIVALVNAWSSKRIAVYLAHRTYRSELVDAAVSAVRKTVEDLERMREAVPTTGPPWTDTQVELYRATRRDVLRSLSQQTTKTPHDKVFAGAQRALLHRRKDVRDAFDRGLPPDRPPDPGQSAIPFLLLSESERYLRELNELIHLAGEGYVFDLKGPSDHAQAMLTDLDETPIERRTRRIRDAAEQPGP